MTIEDLAGHIRDFEAGGYPVTTVVESRCDDCDGRAFRVDIDDDEVRWISVGLRCLKDNALGVHADWKIDYLPSRHLLSQA